MTTAELVKLLQKLNIKYSFREDTPENWRIANPILASNEPGAEIGTGLFKLGDGKTPWNNLGYANLNSDHVEDVPDIDKLYLRKKNMWVELPDVESILRDVKDNKQYLRTKNAWVEYDESDKANKFTAIDFVPIKEFNGLVTELKVDKYIPSKESKAYFSIPLDGPGIEKSFELEYKVDGTVDLVENSQSKYTLIDKGLYAEDIVGKVADVKFRFDTLNHTLTFESSVYLVRVDEELKNSLLIKAERDFDLQDVYNKITSPTKLTIEDLYEYPFSKEDKPIEIDMRYSYKNPDGILEKVFGKKILVNLTDTGTVLVTGVKSILDIRGKVITEDTTIFVPNKAIDIKLNNDNGSIVIETELNSENTRAELILLYTK